MPDDSLPTRSESRAHGGDTALKHLLRLEKLALRIALTLPDVVS